MWQRVTTTWEGKDQKWHLYIDGIEIYSTHDDRDFAMFKSQLKLSEPIKGDLVASMWMYGDLSKDNILKAFQYWKPIRATWYQRLWYRVKQSLAWFVKGVKEVIK